VKKQRILVILAHNVFRRRDTRKYVWSLIFTNCCRTTLGSAKGDISTIFSSNYSIKQPHVIFHGIHHLRHRSCILLTYVTVSVQSDLILPKLQQHLFQMNCIRCVVCEWGTQTTSFSLCTLNIRCNVGWLVIFLSL